MIALAEIARRIDVAQEKLVIYAMLTATVAPRRVLADPSLLLIFTYAPAGLGHLRVTDALYHGLPKGVQPVILGAHDRAVGAIHRFMSIHASLLISGGETRIR